MVPNNQLQKRILESLSGLLNFCTTVVLIERSVRGAVVVLAGPRDKLDGVAFRVKYFLGRFSA
jgi:hypothetical protein